MTSSTPDPGSPAAPPYPRRLIRRLWFVATPILWIADLALRYPQIDPEHHTILYRPGLLTSLPFAATLGYGLAMIVGLGWANRHRPRSILRMTRGHLNGTLVLAALTPVHVVGWIPFLASVLGLFLLFPSMVFPPILFLALAALVLLFWYPIAGLLVSGLKDKRLLVAGVALMFWGAHSAQILWLAVLHF